MSYYQRHRGSDDATFVFIVLLTCAVWTHRTFMQKVEHYALVTTVIFAVLLFIIWTYRLARRTNRRRWINLSLADIDVMSGLTFEHYVANLLKTNGFSNIRLTEKYDFGIDIIADKENVRWGIQVKRCNAQVGAEAVRQAVTALKIYGCDRAMVITNSRFSKVARQLAHSNDCVLIDRNSIFSAK